MLRNHFEVLGLSQAEFSQYSPEEANSLLKRAYHKRSRETHPDKRGTNQEFSRVKEAYEALKSALEEEPSSPVSSPSHADYEKAKSRPQTSSSSSRLFPSKSTHSPNHSKAFTRMDDEYSKDFSREPWWNNRMNFPVYIERILAVLHLQECLKLETKEMYTVNRVAAQTALTFARHREKYASEAFISFVCAHATSDSSDLSLPAHFPLTHSR